MSGRIALAGGGIGGLVAALALARAGFEVELLERAPHFREVGAGLTISPNATRVLDALGLRERLEHAGDTPGPAAILHYRTGEPLMRVQRDDAFAARGRAGLFQIHRADFVALLLEALAAEPRCRIRTGARVVGFEVEAPGVVVRLAGGGTLGADALVGCDGLRSGIRAALFGADAPRFTGQAAFRFLVPAADAHDLMPAGPSAISIGPGGLVNRYYVRHRSWINCIGIARTDAWREEGWLIPSDAAEFAATFAGWHDDVLELARRAPPGQIHKWALFDRDPLPRWTVGTVSLLGDAAHPMLPFLGLGAAMAIEDAWMLAARLAACRSPAEGLLAYEAARRERCAAVLLDSRAQGELYQAVDPESYGRGPHGAELRLKYYPYDVVAAAAALAGAGDATTAGPRDVATAAAPLSADRARPS